LQRRDRGRLWPGSAAGRAAGAYGAEGGAGELPREAKPVGTDNVRKPDAQKVLAGARRQPDLIANPRYRERTPVR